MPADVRFQCEPRFVKILIDIRDDDGLPARRMKRKLFVDLTTETTFGGKVIRELFASHFYKRDKKDPGEFRIMVPTIGRHNGKGESLRLEEFQNGYATRRWGALKAVKIVRRIRKTFEEAE